MKTPVKQTARTVAIFEAFAAEPMPLAQTELAQRLGIPIGTCRGLVRTLEELGYLYRVGPRRMVYPTKRLLALGEVITGHDPVLERVSRPLQRLRSQTAETVILGKRRGDAVVYLDIHEGPQSIRYTARSGDPRPLHASAIGKALLAELEDADLEALLQRIALPRITEMTITDPRRLRRDIAEGRERGYQLTRGENVPDVMTIARVVRVSDEVLAVAVAGPVHRMSQNTETCVAALDRCCRSLARAT